MVKVSMEVQWNCPLRYGDSGRAPSIARELHDVVLQDLTPTPFSQCRFLEDARGC